MMIEVDVRLYATLSYLQPDGKVSLRPGATIGELLEVLQIPRDVPKLYFVNGRKADPESVLKNGDRIGIFPPIAGGSQ